MPLPTALLAGVLAGALLIAPVAGVQPLQRFDDLLPEVERNLQRAVIDFWFPRAVDTEYGGYLVGFDAAGNPSGDGAKMIVTQARMLWLASRLIREGRGGPAMRAAADRGYAFLMERMWDQEHGGFYWEVDRPGGTVRQAHKHLYGQAFGLYALAEYSRATGSPAALGAADRLFALLEEKAHDAEFGGYREFFARDWSAPPPDVRPYLGADARLKLMNTHLHLMEAMSAYYRAGQRPAARERLFELVTIQSSAVIRKDVGAGTDRHERDWTPQLDPDSARASYGHDLENIWLLVDAMDALGLSPQPLVDLFRQVFASSVRYGYDFDRGGFYDSGPLGQPADRRDKIWWVEAEALVSALTMYQLTGEDRYAEVFERTWRFVDEVQTDWQSGEWHPTVQPDGTATGRKGHAWKGPYHNGRALLEILSRLRR